MNTRAEKKRQSLQKILDVASVRLREQGIDGAAIAPVMQEAGLTHGTFYAHFANKDELAQEAFRHAMHVNRPTWLAPRKETWRVRLKRLAAAYLTPGHRDDIGHGCAISALASDVPAASAGFRAAYEQELIETLRQISENDADPHKFDDTIAFFALCVGGLNLARAIGDEKLSRRILKVCRERAAAVD